MHYTNAVLHESLRISCVVYNAIPHYTNAEVNVGNYIIPQGTIVIPSLMNVLLDSDHFSNPHEFNPNRFLNENGEFKPDDHVIAFSLGKRYCLGQSLAEKEYFLFFAGLMHKFDINAVPGQSLPSYHIMDSSSGGIIRSPPTFNLILSTRSG